MYFIAIGVITKCIKRMFGLKKKKQCTQKIDMMYNITMWNSVLIRTNTRLYLCKSKHTHYCAKNMNSQKYSIICTVYVNVHILNRINRQTQTWYRQMKNEIHEFKKNLIYMRCQYHNEANKTIGLCAFESKSQERRNVCVSQCYCDIDWNIQIIDSTKLWKSEKRRF